MNIRNQKKIIILLAVFTIIVIAFNKSYALFQTTAVSDKPVVQITTPDELPVREAVDVLKDTLGKEKGIIGVTTDNNAVTVESDNIREYRYSGSEVDNYIYFNCQDKTTAKDASSKCEKWRILGIFKDENNEEHLKIVRNEPLSGFPETYKVGESTYYIKGDTDTTPYWNEKADAETNNDWSDAGLMQWLNSNGNEGEDIGYLNSLHQNAQNMIIKMTYYLGALRASSSDGLIDSAREAYVDERAVTGCIGNKGPIENNSADIINTNETCRVWANNAATWEGKIGLMYPSDVGFSQSSDNWDRELGPSGINQSWLPQSGSCLISPTLLFSASGKPTGHKNASVYTSDSSVFASDVDSNSYFKVFPTLYLNSKVNIISGFGTEQEPYFLSVQ